MVFAIHCNCNWVRLCFFNVGYLSCCWLVKYTLPPRQHLVATRSISSQQNTLVKNTVLEGIPRKWTCPRKRTIWKGNFIFQPGIFRWELLVSGRVSSETVISRSTHSGQHCMPEFFHGCTRRSPVPQAIGVWTKGGIFCCKVQSGPQKTRSK